MREHLFLSAKVVIAIVVVGLIPYVSNGQVAPIKGKMTIQQYIDRYREDAIREMHEDGVPASITLAQGIKESNAGNSPLAIRANNHFGIKCQKNWTGAQYIQDDDLKDECFRSYETVLQSYADHSEFLKSRPRYAFLFLLPPTDYRGWALGLKAAGYATDPNYAKYLIKIIEEDKLYNLDTVKNPSPELLASIDNFFGVGEKDLVKDSLHPRTIGDFENDLPKHTIKKNNGLRCVIALGGETIDEICNEFDLDPNSLTYFNELNPEKKTHFRKGQLIYLQAKRTKGSEHKHTVAKGEDMYTISQLFGIKLKTLYKKNHLQIGTQPDPGTVLML